MKKKKKEVRTMKARYWYYKGSDIIGEERKEKGWGDYRGERRRDEIKKEREKEGEQL